MTSDIKSDEPTLLAKRPRFDDGQPLSPGNDSKDWFDETDGATRLNSQINQEPWKCWTVEDLAEELKQNGLDEAAEVFTKEKIDGSMLDQITPEFLENMGIRERGSHLKIKKFIERNGCLDAFGYELSGSKVFNDPVHGHMELHPLCVAIIDTPQFQRLRYLKQLGACYFVFPGASHNRFEHSLGVCHLAGQLATALQRRQPWLNISKKDILCVQIAGLCHDLGHGPFSHVFDNKFIPLVVKDGSWKHEKASVAMFDYMYNDPANDLVKKFEQYGLTDADRIFIKEQVAGPSQNTKVCLDLDYIINLLYFF